MSQTWTENRNTDTKEVTQLKRNSLVVWNEQNFQGVAKRSTSIVRMSSSGIFQPAPGIAVLIHHNIYYTLNRTGSHIWALLDGRNTREQIADGLAEVFDMEADLALDATNDFIVMLCSRGLLEAD